MTERVAGLAFCDGTEERRDVRVTLDVGRLCKVDVAPVGLALSCEGHLQVRLGLGTRELGHRVSSSCRWRQPAGFFDSDSRVGLFLTVAPPPAPEAGPGRPVGSLGWSGLPPGLWQA